MTAEIGAPAAGADDAADPAGGLPDADGADDVAMLVGVLVGDSPGRPSMSCEHPATSNGTATSMAIRIDSG
ncbi:hypothetical protein [Mycobacterium kansasii]|uniref:Uncharacterized protein n=1 Tax=Mycobacterium kansasii TaxID=1768 RepID=A0A1V3WD99_MYCKA|nr:hypothetical protein BZL29_8281 [Mycobacterium kansasii]OOK74194.1 hypothetical protein BZL30_4580 [Mycobacterium kansasii]BCI87929.1 hypothetical protein NIIDMKKI_31350 [Mycobacterium kansasii]